MKSLRITLCALLACGITMPLHAASIPAPDDNEGWNQLVDLFAECSAVYNLAATLNAAPPQADTTYRELANNALVAGVYSSQKIGLSDNYLESIYLVKYNLWQPEASDKKRAPRLLGKAEQCLVDSLAVQNQLVSDLRENSANK